MKERATKNSFIMVTYTIYPYDKLVVVSDLLGVAANGVPSIYKALKREINSERI